MSFCIFWYGRIRNESFTVDYSQPNQRYILPNANIDTTSLRVYVTDLVNEEYVQYSNIFSVDKNSRIFLIQEIDDEKYQILFGDDLIGKKPKNGSVINISYIVTKSVCISYILSQSCKLNTK